MTHNVFSGTLTGDAILDRILVAWLWRYPPGNNLPSKPTSKLLDTRRAHCGMSMPIVMRFSEIN